MGDVGGIKPEQEKVELFEKVTGRDAQNGADPVTGTSSVRLLNACRSQFVIHALSRACR